MRFLKPVLLMMLLASGAFAQTDKAQLEVFKKEAIPLQAAVDEAVNSLVPGPAGVLEHAKATYLPGYGVVVSLEASFEPGHTPFSSPKSPAEVRTIVEKRRRDVQAKLEQLLKDRVGKMQSLGAMESLTIALHLFNSNPVDISNLPSQLVLTIKKAEPDATNPPAVSATEF